MQAPLVGAEHGACNCLLLPRYIGMTESVCRRQTSADEADIHDTVLGKISKADLSGCQVSILGCILTHVTYWCPAHTLIGDPV